MLTLRWEVRALGEQLDAHVGDVAAPLDAEPLQLGALDSVLDDEAHVRDDEALVLVHDKLLEPRFHGLRGHLRVSTLQRR